MATPDETTTITILRWYFTENQARNATINQIAGGEPLSVIGSWEFGASNQTLRASIDMDPSAFEGALDGAQAGDTIQIVPLFPGHPEFSNGNAFEVTATRTSTT